MSAGRLILRNSFLNFVASVSQRLGHTIIFILVARLLEPDSAGAFKLANTYSSIVLALSLWGLDQLLIREVARDRSAAGRYLGGYLGLRVLLAALVWLLLALALPFLPYSPATRELILVMSATILPATVSNLYQSVWVALEDVRPISVLLLGFSLLRVVGGALALWQAASLPPVAYLFLFLSLIEMALHLWLTHRRLPLPGFRWRVDLPFWKENLRLASPLILVSFILIVEYQFDEIILSLFRPQAEVGVYGTAVTVLSLLLFLSRSYQLAIFPAISRAYHTGRPALQRLYSRSIVYLLLAALPVTLAVSLFSRPLIVVIVGPEYEAAAAMLRVLAWAFFFSAVNVSNSRLMIVANRQRVMALFALASMTANVLLSLLLVPRYGGLGSAWARVLAMPVYTIPALLYVQRHLCPFDWQAWRPVASPPRSP